MEPTTGGKQPTTWVGGVSIGPYLLLREIARGGMGEIWLAHHRGPAGFERLVVLKRIIAGPEDDPTMLSMFLDEARIVSQLHHPNVVQVSELGQDGASYYLVMEYLAGQTLGRIARRYVEWRQALPTRHALEIVSEAARGLGYAHRRKGNDGRALEIVHRDVSPQNILVTYEGHTKVLDFGIASAAGRGTRTATGVLKGKIAYMSPEQALGTALGPQVDVFALGVILFELLSNTRLYSGADDITILRRLVSGEALPRLKDRSRVDPRLDALVATAMAWDPQERFADGEVLADAIDEVLHQLPLEPLSLRDTLQTLFSTEIAQLPEFQRVTQLTPSQASSESLPSRPATPAEPPPQRVKALAGVVAGLVVVVGIAVAVLVSPPSAGPTEVVPVIPPREPSAGGPSSIEAKPEAPSTAEEPRPAVVGPSPNGETPVLDADAGAAVVVAVEAVDAGESEPAARVVKRGKLSLETEPWTRVFFGKRVLGETPLLEVPLPAGRQRLRLVNPDEGIDTVIEVDVVAESTVVKRLSL